MTADAPRAPGHAASRNPADGSASWTDAEEAAGAIQEAFGGHGEHGRIVPPDRRRTGEVDNRRAPTFDDQPDRRAQLEAATAKDRETYTANGYQPVECRYCHAEVEVRKNSEKHTSVQWPRKATDTCPLRDQWHLERESTCPKMRQSIKHAYAEGIITLASGVDPEDEEHMVNPLFVAPEHGEGDRRRGKDAPPS
ncbi:hypothetical protein [Dietzia sp.]|uniref:hypothetical protein n=1 Tax=Dietzia sp. TaxID=1871616 RepID=UPI002FD9FDC3